LKILETDELQYRLEVLLADSESVEIAVAYIGQGPPLTALLDYANRTPKSLRVIAGVNGFVTDAKALSEIRAAAQLHIFGDTSDPKFHPKMFLFYMGSRTICWIGSANLTRSAFGLNTELICEVTDLGEAAEIFERWWSQESTEPSETWIKQYSDLSKTLNPSPIRKHLEGPAGPSYTWSRYVKKLKAISQERIDGILQLVDEGRTALSWDWREITAEQRAILLGFDPYSDLGNLRQAKTAKDIFSEDKTYRAARLEVHSALKSLAPTPSDPTDKNFDKSLERAFVALTKIKGIKKSVASRLLAITRPDVCVSLNKKSIEYFSKQKGMTRKDLSEPEGYSELCQWIRTQDWWSTPFPKTREEQRIWSARAALQDVLSYEEWVQQSS